MLALPAAALFTLVAGTTKRELQSKAIDEGRLTAALMSSAIHEQFFGLSRYVSSYASRIRLQDAVRNRDQVTVNEILWQFVTENARFSRATVADPSGKMLYDYPHDPKVIDRSFADRDWYRGALESNGPYVSVAYRRAALRSPLVVAVAQRIEDRAGAFVGILMAQYTLSDIQEWIASIRPMWKGKLYVADHAGQFVTTALTGGMPPTPTLEPPVRELLSGRRGFVFGADPIDGTHSLITGRKVDGLGWAVLVSRPSVDVFAAVAALERGVLALFLAALAGVGWLGTVWRRTLLRYDERVKAAESKLLGAKDELEERVRQRTAELSEANEALQREMETRLQVEEQLTHTQKLESIGRLAGGIAHDFNNHLTPIMGFASLLEQSMEEGDPKRDSAQQIQNAAKRAADLTKQLLAVARRQIIQPLVLDLNKVLRQSESLLRRTLGEDIDLVACYSGETWLVKLDPGQFEQILLNLVVNAREAMPKGGKLTLETATVTLSEQYAVSHPEVVPGEFMMVGISDTGNGMDQETLRRVFEPFFTTKPRGTGLGLATTYGIVKQSGGHIWAYSEPGVGTTFKIYLPRCAEEVAQEPPKPDSATLKLGSETILLVEDEALVREIAERVLSEGGYKVLVAESAIQGLEIASRPDTTVEMLVTDVVMPNMTGKELAGKLAAIQPHAKVLYMSGYTENSVIHHGVLDDGIAFLPKPFTPGDLLRKVREVLDAEPAKAA